MNEKKIYFTPVGEGIYLVETYYLNRTEFTGCYVMHDHDEAAIIETNTNHAVPFILGTLEQLNIPKENVKYVILTHIHLDHAGGAGELMSHLPNANLLLHPRGRKHIIDPGKLIESVKQVYGEDQYKQLYGNILPVPKDKVKTMNDGEWVLLGNRKLTVFDTAGHAKHHFIIFDEKTRSVFSGDNFGIAYPRMTFGSFRMVFPSTSPTQFEPDRALETYKKIVDLQPSRVLFTHFGGAENISAVHDQLKEWIEFSVDRAEIRYKQDYRNEELTSVLQDDLWSRFVTIFLDTRGSVPTDEEKEWLELDTNLNAQGLAFYIQGKYKENSPAEGNS